MPSLVGSEMCIRDRRLASVRALELADEEILSAADVLGLRVE